MRVQGKTVYTRNPVHVYRDAEMVLLFRDGLTLQAIGDRFGVTREYVRQRIATWGLSGDCGGRAAQSLLKARIWAESKTAKREAREQRLQNKFGVTLEEWSAVGPLGRNAFQRQRKSAHTRRIAWNLTLGQWWRIWQESGHWHERGKHRGQYVMARWADDGPYSPENVYITTCSENLKHSFITKPGKARYAKALANREAQNF